MFKLVLALLCALFVAIFAVQNYRSVTVGFLTWNFEISLALVIVGATVLGAVVVFLLGMFQQITRGFKLRDYRNKVQQLEKEVEELRDQLAEACPFEGEFYADEQDEQKEDVMLGEEVVAEGEEREPGTSQG